MSAFITRAAETMRDFDPLDLLVASMIAETGEPDEQAEAWVRDAIAKARAPQIASDRKTLLPSDQHSRT